MSYTQTIPFDPSKGGTVAGLCLDNVRRGYGIANKYSSAWEAWQNTEQHRDNNIPTGVAVPLYYSYTTTLDGVTQNYGHINVQLPDGIVWSDGIIYASIDAYTAHHNPKFVGWGESVNDFKVIEEGEEMYPNDGDLTNIYNSTGWPGHVPNDNDKAFWVSGTGNPDWTKGADDTWKALMYQVIDYVSKNSAGSASDYEAIGQLYVKKG